MLDCNLYTCMCMCIYTYNNVHTLPFTTRTVNQESEKWMRSEWRVFQARIWIFGPGAACASRRPELRNCLAYERLAAWKQAKQAKQALLSRFGSVLSVLLHFALGNSQMSLDVSCLFSLEYVRVLLKSLESQFGRGSNIRGLPAGHRLRTGPLPSEPGRAKAAATPEGCRRLGSRWIQLDQQWISCDCTPLHFPTDSNCFGFDVLAAACLCALALRQWHQLLLSAGY